MKKDKELIELERKIEIEKKKMEIEMLIELKKTLLPLNLLVEQKMNQTLDPVNLPYYFNPEEKPLEIEAQDQLTYVKNKDGNYEYTVIYSHIHPDVDVEDGSITDAFAEIEIKHETFSPIGDKPISYEDISRKFEEMYLDANTNDNFFDIQAIAIFPGHIYCQLKKGHDLLQEIKLKKRIKNKKKIKKEN